jgi:hypothetical protein
VFEAKGIATHGWFTFLGKPYAAPLSLLKPLLLCFSMRCCSFTAMSKQFLFVITQTTPHLFEHVVMYMSVTADKGLDWY